MHFAGTGFRGSVQRRVLTCTCLVLVAGAAVSFTTWQYVRAADAGAAPVPLVNPAAGLQSSQPAGDGPRFRCDKPVHDFGVAWGGDKVPHAYIIANDGKAPLEILKVAPSCGCTLAGDYDKVIAPGKEGKIPISLSTTAHAVPMSKTITVDTNDPANAHVILTIKGTVKTRIQMEPLAGASWGRIMPSSPESVTVKLTNNMPTPLKLELVPDQPKSIFSATVKEVEPGKVYEIVVTAQKPYADGQNMAQLRFKTGLTEQPEIIIPCSLLSPPLVEVIPPSIVASTGPTQEYRQLIIIRYNGQGTMKVTSVKPTPEAIKTELKEQEPGKLYNIPLVFPAGFETPADAPGTIAIETDVPGKEKINIPVRVRLVTPSITAESLIGKPAPIVMLKTPDNQDLRIGGTTGKVKLIDFVSTWCPHCKKQLPMVERLVSAYKGKDVEFAAVSGSMRQNTPPEVAAMAKALNLTMPVGVDLVNQAQSAGTKYGATAYPVLFVIGKTGIIEAVHRGSGMPQDPDSLAKMEAQIRAQIDALLEGKTRATFPPSAVAANTVTPAQPQPPQQGPALVFDKLRQELGPQKPGAPVIVNLHYRNPGTEAVALKVTSPSEGLKLGENYAQSLAPGSAGEIRCEFTTPAQPGPFSHRFVVESNDPARKSQEVTLAGAVQKYIELLPPAGISFSRNTRTHSIPSLATLVYNGPGSVKYSTPESSSPQFEATVDPIPGGPYSKLIVKAKPPFTVGEHKATIRIATDSKEQPVVEVPVTLSMPPRIEITPASVVVAPSPRLQRSSVSIRNNGDKSLSMLEVKSSSDKIHWQFYPESDGLSYRLMLMIPPQAEFSPGADGEKITIRTDDAELKEIVIPIKLGTPEEQAKTVSQAPPVPLPPQR